MSGKLEILLVEDNEGDIELTQRAFRDESLNCNISVTNNGMEAMAFLRKQGGNTQALTPHLIFLDLNMPRMDGKKFLETIKMDPQFKAIPIIMLTSSQSDSDIRDCYERQASCYVVKPFNGKEFASTVRQVVDFWRNIGQLPASRS